MKTHLKNFLVIISLLSMCILINSCFENCHTCNCSDSGKTYYKYDKAGVGTALFVKDTINTADTLKIAFWGNIGSDSCYSFGYFQASSIEHQTDISIYRTQEKIWC